MSDTLCSSVKHLVKDVLCMKIGICAREIELVEVSTGKPSCEKKNNIAIDDRFKLKIPISDQIVTWEVVFNCSLPNCPPDFDLNDVEFNYSITVDSMEQLVPSLNNWNHRKDKALVNVISELRSAYLKYQVEKLEIIDNRWAYEYTSLVNERNLPVDNVEVFVDNNIVHFLLKLDVDLSQIYPSVVTEDYIIALAVKYGALSASRATSLLTSNNIVRLIGTTIELPRNIKSEESLTEFADEVVKSVENQVHTVILKRQEKRKLFIFEYLKRMGRFVISYDSVEYNNASFLLEKDGFVCILELVLLPMFPSKPPRYRLLSVYPTMETRQPFSQVINMPFNEAWDIHVMVDQALNLLKSKRIQQFRDCTIAAFQLPK